MLLEAEADGLRVEADGSGLGEVRVVIAFSSEKEKNEKLLIVGNTKTHRVHNLIIGLNKTQQDWIKQVQWKPLKVITLGPRETDI